MHNLPNLNRWALWIFGTFGTKGSTMQRDRFGKFSIGFFQKAFTFFVGCTIPVWSQSCTTSAAPRSELVLLSLC
jgi:hypothetical protein